jgi:Fic family protein
VLYLSHYFRRYRQDYYARLQAVRDDGDWEGWLSFFLRGVKEVSEEATETARRILTMREQHRAAIADRLGRGAGSGHKILEMLFKHPIVSVHDVQARMGTTYAAANNLVGRLVELGILAEITGNARNRRFRYHPYVQLFAEGP